MICMIEHYIVTSNFSFAFDYDMSCVLLILKILKYMHRGLHISRIGYWPVKVLVYGLETSFAWHNSLITQGDTCDSTLCQCTQLKNY